MRLTARNTLHIPKKRLELVRKKIIGHDALITLRNYLADLYNYAGRKLFASIILAFFSSLTAGVSLVMLIPLLSLVGLENKDELSGFFLIIKNIADTIHFPLTVTNILILYMILLSIRSILSYYQAILLSDIRNGFIKHVKQRLYNVIAFSRWKFHLKNNNADLTHLLTQDIARIAHGTDFVIGFLLGIVMLAIYMLIAFHLSWKLSILAFITGALLLLILFPQISRAKKIGKDLTRTAQNAQRTISDFLDGIKLAKSSNSEDFYINRYTGVLEDWHHHISTYTRSNTLANTGYQLASGAALCMLFFFGSQWLSIPIAELLVLLLVFSRIFPRVSSLHGSIQQIALMLPAYKSAFNTHRDYSFQKEFSTDTFPPTTLNKSIQLRNVSFHFEGIDENVLNNINCVITARKTTAIIGESGAGKSTLADLITGLMSPTEGDILIDDTLLKQESKYSWRKKVSYIPQETFLFHDSIRNNLQWTHTKKNEHQLWKALRLSAADKFVAGLSDGIDTIIGERGIRLSGGERQRIALARALLANPELLVLDESTSALDEKNEAFIHQSIERLHGKLTIILITHRLSTLRYADHVFEIKNGKVNTSLNLKDKQ